MTTTPCAHETPASAHPTPHFANVSRVFIPHTPNTQLHPPRSQKPAEGGQQRPTAANNGQKRPTAANEGQCRPIAANKSPQWPTAANESPKRPIAHPTPPSSLTSASWGGVFLHPPTNTTPPPSLARKREPGVRYFSPHHLPTLLRGWGFQHLYLPMNPKDDGARTMAKAFHCSSPKYFFCPFFIVLFISYFDTNNDDNGCLFLVNFYSMYINANKLVAT
jgi:hypothetical protein